MFPKQITPFILTHETPSADILNEKFTANPITKILDLGVHWFTEGFAKPTPFSNDFVFTADKTVSGCLKRFTRILPSDVVAAHVAARVAEIEQKEKRHVGISERTKIKEKVIDDLLPKAFIRNSSSHFIFNQSDKMLFVYESSEKKAENTLSKIRQALGGLGAVRIQTATSIQTLMNEWFYQQKCAGNFEFDDYTLLKHSQVSSIRVKGCDLTSDNINKHAQNGFHVHELGLVWREQIAFVLTADFVLKRIQFLDISQEKANEQGYDMDTLHAMQQIITSHNIASLINELIELCGGLAQDN